MPKIVIFYRLSFQNILTLSIICLGLAYDIQGAIWKAEDHFVMAFSPMSTVIVAPLFQLSKSIEDDNPKHSTNSQAATKRVNKLANGIILKGNKHNCHSCRTYILAYGVTTRITKPIWPPTNQLWIEVTMELKFPIMRSTMHQRERERESCDHSQTVTQWRKPWGL